MCDSIYTSLLAYYVNGKGQDGFSSLSYLVASLLYVYLDLKSRTKQNLKTISIFWLSMHFKLYNIIKNKLL